LWSQLPNILPLVLHNPGPADGSRLDPTHRSISTLSPSRHLASRSVPSITTNSVVPEFSQYSPSSTSLSSLWLDFCDVPRQSGGYQYPVVGAEWNPLLQRSHQTAWSFRRGYFVPSLRHSRVLSPAPHEERINPAALNPSYFPSLQALAIISLTGTSRVLSALLSDPASPSSLETPAFLDSVIKNRFYGSAGALRFRLAAETWLLPVPGVTATALHSDGFRIIRFRLYEAWAILREAEVPGI